MNGNIRRLLSCAVMACLFASPALATTITFGTAGSVAYSSAPSWSTNTATGWNGNLTGASPYSLGAGNEGLVNSNRFILASSNTTFASKLTLDTGGLRIASDAANAPTVSDLVLNNAYIYRFQSSSVFVLNGNISLQSGSHNYFDSSGLTAGSAGAFTIAATITGDSTTAIERTSNTLSNPANDDGIIGSSSALISGNNSGAGTPGTFGTFEGQWRATDGALRFSSAQAVGTGTATLMASTGGTLSFTNDSVIANQITVNAGGRVGYFGGGTGTVTLNDLNLHGGTIIKKSDSSATHTLAGAIKVQEDSFIDNSIGTLTVTAQFFGTNSITKLGAEVTSINANNSNVTIGLPSPSVGSNFSGDWIVEAGRLNLAWTSAASTANYHLAVGSGKIVPLGTGIVRLNSKAATWTLGNDLGGTGKLQVGTDVSDTAALTLTLQGSEIDPGNGSTIGTLTIEPGRSSAYSAHVALQTNINDATNASLAIDVAGTGGVAGTDYDQLRLTRGNLSGLGNADLVVRLDPGLTSGEIAALGPLTIVELLHASTAIDTNTLFANNVVDGFNNTILVEGGAWRANIVYNPQSIVLSNFQAVPEPGTWLLLAIGGAGMALARVRRTSRRRGRAK